MNLKCQEFWYRVSKLAEKQGISQKSVCEKIGMNYSTYKGLKLRVLYPDAAELMAMADAYCCTPEYLIYGKDNNLDEDLMQALVNLKKLTPEQRSPIMAIIQGQVDYWLDFYNKQN